MSKENKFSKEEESKWVGATEGQLQGKGRNNFLMEPASNAKLPISAPDFRTLALSLSSSLIKDNAELQGEMICQRVFHFLPLWNDADWSEESSPRTNAHVLRTSVCLQQKQSAQRAALLFLLTVPAVSPVPSTTLIQAKPPLWSCTGELLHFPFFSSEPGL